MWVTLGGFLNSEPTAVCESMDMRSRCLARESGEYLVFLKQLATVLEICAPFARILIAWRVCVCFFETGLHNITFIAPILRAWIARGV